MSQFTIITGSPSKQSRSAALSEYIAAYLQNEKYEVKTVHVRDLPAEDLLYANFSSPAIQDAQKKVADADAVIIVSPIYKASYTGILKTFLDLIPEKGLHNKTV
ncbi:NAD(P)H-dependent oxidoreductase, partial [Priestia megaterium]